MCEINIESISKLLQLNKSEINKPNNIGSMDICQLSQEPKIEKYENTEKLEKAYIIIIKVLRNIKSSTIVERLSSLTPIGVGIIYVEDVNNEKILIIS